MMSVAGLYSPLPDYLGHDEGWPVAELVRVKAGDLLTGTTQVALPFVSDVSDPGLHPNPFTPWGAGDFKVPFRTSERVRQITSFQMALQAFSLPQEVVSYWRDTNEQFPSSGDRETLVVRDSMIDMDLIENASEHSAEFGKYWASCLLSVRNRYPRTTDLSRWVVSPIYKVEWPVGQHPPIGIACSSYDNWKRLQEAPGGSSLRTSSKPVGNAR